jgi:hypothetical protein
MTVCEKKLKPFRYISGQESDQSFVIFYWSIGSFLLRQSVSKIVRSDCWSLRPSARCLIAMTTSLDGPAFHSLSAICLFCLLNNMKWLCSASLLSVPIATILEQHQICRNFRVIYLFMIDNWQIKNKVTSKKTSILFIYWHQAFKIIKKLVSSKDFQKTQKKII